MTVPSEEGGEGLTGLARALLEAGVNEMMSAQDDAACEAASLEMCLVKSCFRKRARLSFEFRHES